MKVLKLSAQGLPQSWISLEQAVIHYAAGEVRWESGAQIARFRGGHNAISGEQSVIAINSIIGTKGVPSINPFELKPSLTNSKLFARDRNVCAYCGGHFHEEDLTREHIVPFARNGQDHWMNVVTACRPCNHRKGPRTPEQAHMPLAIHLTLAAADRPAALELLSAVPGITAAETPEGLHVDCPRGSKMAVLGVLVPLGAALQDLQIQEPSLEDVYFDLRKG